MKEKNRNTGNWGEQQAAQYLKTLDYSIAEQNFGIRYKNEDPRGLFFM